jgi:hypothetical protein
MILLRRVVSRTSDDEAPAGGTFQLDRMERTVSFYALWPINDSVLTTQTDVSLVQILHNPLGGLVEVHLAAALIRELLKDLLTWRESRLWFVIDYVNRRVSLLTNINIVGDACVTCIVYAVREEQDEVSGRDVVGDAKLIAARLVKGVEDRSTSKTALVIRCNVSNAAFQQLNIGCPVRLNLHFRVEPHDKGTITFLIKEPFSILAGNPLIKAKMFKHRPAGINHHRHPNRKVLIHLKRNNLSRWSSVVRYSNVADFQVVHGNALPVGSVKYDADFVYRDV